MPKTFFYQWALSHFQIRFGNVRYLLNPKTDQLSVMHLPGILDSANNDLRIKMCIEKNEEDFITIHHELGHIFYYQAYNHLPTLFQGGANDGFHEAFGDLLTLSITPDYLKKIGFISEDEAKLAKNDSIGLLMKQALEGVVVIPWALMLDKWRAGVFTGDIAENELNQGLVGYARIISRYCTTNTKV